MRFTHDNDLNTFVRHNGYNPLNENTVKISIQVNNDNDNDLNWSDDI